MSAVADLETAAGLLLLFFLPGYAVAKATFPDWRVRGAGGRVRLVELVALSFVLSVALTVLAGYALLVGNPTGFSADWSDPLLEGILAGIALAGFAGALARGGFDRIPPTPHPAPAEDPGGEGAWELERALDELAREERRILHRLRREGSRLMPSESERLSAELEAVRQDRESLRVRREAEYAR